MGGAGGAAALGVEAGEAGGGLGGEDAGELELVALGLALGDGDVARRAAPGDREAQARALRTGRVDDVDRGVVERAPQRGGQLVEQLGRGGGVAGGGGEPLEMGRGERGVVLCLVGDGRPSLWNVIPVIGRAVWALDR